MKELSIAPEMLTSLQNPLVKQMRKLRSRKERHKQHLFLLEGTHLLEVAAQLGCPFTVLCGTPAWQQKHPQLWYRAQELAARTEIVSPEVLGALATTEHPDGVVAAVSRDGIGKMPQEPIALGLVLERLQDPGNLGTIVRTAAATKVEGIWLSEDSVDLDNPKVLRASAGEWFRVPTAVSSDLIEVIEHLRATGVQTIATLPQATQTYWDVDWKKPTVVVLGNEGTGLSEDLAALADERVRIPLNSGVESLNVAIAAALLLYEAQRQRLSV
nr:RNA methyltransferase [Lusitaniella coriacea]